MHLPQSFKAQSIDLTVAYAQPSVAAYSIVLDRRPAADGANLDGVTIRYTGLENRRAQIYEAFLYATTDAECLASRDFTTAVLVGPERATLIHDRRTGTNTLRWIVENERKDTCRVLLVRSGVDSSDLAVWQSNYGNSGLSANSLQFETAYRVLLPADGNEPSPSSAPRVEMLLRKSR